MGEFSDDIKSGDRVKALEALRDRLADAAEKAPARELAPLARQLAQVLEALEAERKPEEVSKLEQLRKRRDSRAPGAANPTRAQVNKQRGSGSNRAG